MIHSPQAERRSSGASPLRSDRWVSDASWRSRPLCCRYALVEFKTLDLPIDGGDAVRHVPWCWALGLFTQDQYEVLGAWPAQASSAEVGHDLHQRGIEQIKAITASDGTECSEHFPGAVTLPRAFESEAAGTPTRAGVFGPRRVAALKSAATTADRLQRRVANAIQRRAPFADEAEAVAFLLHALEKADRRFQEEPKTRIDRRPAVRPSSRTAVTGVA